MRHILPILLAIFVASVVMHAATTLWQHGDAYSGMIHAQASSLIAGESLYAMNDYHEPMLAESRCGLFPHAQFARHYPPGMTYAIVVGTVLGLQPKIVPALFAALCMGLLIYQLALRSVWSTLPVIVLFVGALFTAPAIGGYLTYPLEIGVDFSGMCLLAAAALCRKPAIPLLVAGLLVGWLSRLVPVLAMVVAGFVIAAHGVGWVTLRAGAMAILGYWTAWVTNLLQILCFHGGSWPMFMQDYVTGGPDVPGGSSIVGRVTGVGFNERLTSVAILAPAYYREAMVGEHGDWVTWSFIYLMIGCVAVLRPALWPLVGAALIVVSFPALYGFILPQMLEPHLHLMPRLVVVVLLMGVAALSVRPEVA